MASPVKAMQEDGEVTEWSEDEEEEEEEEEDAVLENSPTTQTPPLQAQLQHAAHAGAGSAEVVLAGPSAVGAGGSGGVTATLVSALQQAARATDPPPVQYEIRGVWPTRDAAQWTAVARFTKTEHVQAFVHRNCAAPSNPEDHSLHHMVTLWTSYAQLVHHVFPQLGRMGPPRKDAAALQSVLAAAVATTVPGPGWSPRILPATHPLLSRVVTGRLASSVYAHTCAANSGAHATLRYLYHHLRSGLFLSLRDNSLQACVLFCNRHYRNRWGTRSRLHPRLPGGSVAGAKSAIALQHARVPMLQDTGRWWANGRLLCEGSSASIWNDAFVQHIKDMIQCACATYLVQDADFFWNKADAPRLLRSGREPWPWLFAPHAAPLPLEVSCGMAPILSFYTHDAYADIPMPTPTDWELATQRIFAPQGGWDARAFLQAARKTPWEARAARAVFRGSSTGAGTDTRSNQRMALATFLHPALDAGITSSNTRLKVQLDYRVGVQDTNLPRAAYLNMEAQVRYKYWVYAAGHAAASRFSAVMLSGSVPIVLDAPGTCVGPDTWAASHFSGPYLTSLEEDVPETATMLRVHADLSNLGVTLDWCLAHDAEAAAVAQRAVALASRVYSADNIVWYVASVLNAIAELQRRQPAFGGAHKDADGGWCAEWNPQTRWDMPLPRWKAQ